MTNRVGTKGQVVIPKPIREELGIGPGDEVVFARTGAGAELRPVRSGTPLRGLLAPNDGGLEQSWADHKREERQLEKDKEKRLESIGRQEPRA